jgi:hypothetical protein
VAAALGDDIGEHLGREQLVTVVGKEGVHRPIRDQMAAPAGRVQRASEPWRAGLTSPAVCPLSTPNANHRIDPTSQIDRNDRTTPAQHAPRRCVEAGWLLSWGDGPVRVMIADDQGCDLRSEGRSGRLARELFRATLWIK